MSQNNIEKIKCPYCGEEFSRITPNHLKKHGVTWEQYLKENRPIKYMEELLINFLNEYYITTRFQYLLYPPNGKTYTIKANKEERKYPLNKKHLQEHLNHKQTYGIFFPELGSRLIGLDLDVLDKEALMRIYKFVTRFVPSTAILMSISGGKGYHIDIFLNRIIDRAIIKRFYELVRENTGLCVPKGVKNQKLEVRGGSAAGYKMPFGYHFKKKSPCPACDEFGNPIKADDLEALIKSRTKADVQNIINAVMTAELNAEVEVPDVEVPDVEVPDVEVPDVEVPGPVDLGILTDDEIIDFENIKAEVTPLANYENLHEDFIEDLAQIYRKGFNGKGMRVKYTFKIALFLKTHLRFKQKDVLEEMLDWMERCKGYGDSKEEFERNIRATVKRIFKENLNLVVAARSVKISKIEIKEILSIKCRTTQETQALRQLYYMMFIHSKAYSDEEGIFFMTLEQMQSMGAVKNKGFLLKQIDKLGTLGKIYKFPSKRVSRIRYAPSEYKLVALAGVTIELKPNTKTFTLCTNPEKCVDCMEKATCYLITQRTERHKYLKGKTVICPFNNTEVG